MNNLQEWMKDLRAEANSYQWMARQSEDELRSALAEKNWREVGKQAHEIMRLEADLSHTQKLMEQLEKKLEAVK